GPHSPPNPNFGNRSRDHVVDQADIRLLYAGGKQVGGERGNLGGGARSIQFANLDGRISQDRRLPQKESLIGLAVTRSQRLVLDSLQILRPNGVQINALETARQRSSVGFQRGTKPR